MMLIRSLLFSLVFYSVTVFAVLIAFPVALLGPDRLRGYAVGWARFHGWCCRLLLGVRSKVEGTPPRGPVIIASKHQSMYETIQLLTMLDRPAVVLKKELADIPGWGRVAQIYGAIPVDRSGSARALRAMLTAGRTAIAEGRGILIFPEGTRVEPGERPPLRAGFSGLYKTLGLPVIAVAMDSGEIFKRSGFIRRSGTVTFRFADPLPPGIPRSEIEVAVHERINALDRSIAVAEPLA